MTWKLSLRHLFRHWRLNLVLLIIMVLGASLLAILPMLAITIAQESLSQSLHSAPVQVRNMIIQGESKTDEPPDEITQSLGFMLNDWMAVREGDVLGFPIITKSDGNQLNLYPATLVLNLKSFDRLAERVRVIEGRLPEGNVVSALRDSQGTPIYEAAIGAQAFQRTELSVGDQVSPAGGRYHLEIVGVVEPLEPSNEIWWGDNQMMPFSAWRRIYISPDIDEWNVSLLVHPNIMRTKIYHDHYWRILLDHQRITALNAPSVREMLIGLQSQLSEGDLALKTELIELIERFEADLALAQVSLLLLTFQSLVVVFYLLVMFGNFLVEQSQNELATLAGRGFSRSQITGLFARSTSILALLTVLLAPLAAWGFMIIWSEWQGRSATNFIPRESWLLAFSAGVFSWIFLVISVYRATNRNLLSGQGQERRFYNQTRTQRNLIWDVFILALGVLAYWQLTQGSTIIRELGGFGDNAVTGISDPILLLGPSLMLLAVALILIRLLPFLWRFLAWVSRKGRGLAWYMIFTRLARQPIGPSQVTLLISLTAGLTFFSSVFVYSMDNWQKNMARYVAGANIRIQQPLIKSDDGQDFPASLADNERTEVIRVKTTFLVDEYQRLNYDLLAVNPEIFSSVVSYPPGSSSFTMDQIMGVLRTDSPDVLPAIISSNINARHLGIGDQITMELGEETYPFEIVGIIINFPLLEDVFVITDLSQFEQKIDLESMALMDLGSRETWFSTEAGEHQKLIAELQDAGLEDFIVGNSQTQLETLQNNLVFREVTTAFGLNALILIPLSLIGVFLILIFSAQRRTSEFGVLQAMGLSRSQLKGLLMREGLIYVSLGLLIGIGIGLGLAILMKPFLTQILPPLKGNLVLNQLLIDWFAVGLRFVALIGFYGIGLLLLVISVFRNQRSVQF